MKTIKIIIAILIISTIVFASCKKADEPIPVPTERKFCIQINDATVPQYILQYGNIYTKDNGDTIKKEPSLYVYPHLLQYKGIDYKPCN